MEIDEIVDYATKSPENTNPAVLRSMLGQLSGGSGGVFVVNLAYDDETDAYISDKSKSEIISAWNGGVPVIFKSSTGEQCLATVLDIMGMVSVSAVSFDKPETLGTDILVIRRFSDTADENTWLRFEYTVGITPIGGTA